MKKRIITSKNDIIISTLDDECIRCITENVNNKEYASQVCMLDNKTKKLGFITNRNGTLYACSGNSKTTKNFKDEIHVYASHIHDLILLGDEIAEKKVQYEMIRVKRVMHNLTSINGKCIQEIFSFIPDNKLAKQNVKQVVDFIRREIEKKTKVAALLFLRIYNFNSNVKAELTVYEKLLIPSPILSPNFYNVRNLILSMSHMHYTEFNKLRVRVIVEECYDLAYCDYASVIVTFYHLIQNATKYVKPNTTIDISFKKEETFHVVEIKMTSLHFYEEDINKIFNENYSGINAKKTQLAGDGIGMYITKRLLELNKSQIIIDAGEEIMKHNGVEYSDNCFLIKIPRSKK